MSKVTDRVVNGVIRRAVSLGRNGYSKELVADMLRLESIRDIGILYGRFEEYKTFAELAKEFKLTDGRVHQIIDTLVYRTTGSSDSKLKLKMFLTYIITKKEFTRVYTSLSRAGIRSVSDLAKHSYLDHIRNLSDECLRELIEVAKEEVSANDTKNN